MTKPEIQDTISKIPQLPGVYKYFDKDDKLIYVGKAKSLKNRVSSYFHSKEGLNAKTRRLVKQIHRLEYTIVNSEFDALLLENNLVKIHQPKYNIQLRDDKSFPYLVITKEPFPRIISRRGFDKTLGEYFGPYINVKAMNVVVDLLRKLYTLRTCSYHLSEENITQKKFKVCLEYHIGNCLGPCAGHQEEGDYLNDLEQARNVLKGEIGLAVRYFKEKIKTHSENLEFEKAQKAKDKLDRLEQFQTKSVVASAKDQDLDIFTITSTESKAFVNFIKLQKGLITASKNYQIAKKLDEPDDEILSQVVIQIREEIGSTTKEVLSNIELDLDTETFLTVTPKIGDKRKLVELSLKNALAYKLEKQPDKDKTRENRVLKTLQEDLRLTQLPTHIECFDNSNIQGSNPVASMVCFKMGKPSKKDYRHFKIKTVEGPNDFDSMKEIVGRRYSRLVNEKAPLPQLIVIDGGKGQLGAAVDALKEVGVYEQVAVVGIAKRLEEIYTPGDADPVMISKKSESLKLIQQLRNEAHRFAITFHRDLRSKNFINSELESIPGIGKSTFEKVLKKYRTLSNVSKATQEELAELVGSHKASLIKEGLKK